jgi:hypothetical protein
MRIVGRIGVAGARRRPIQPRGQSFLEMNPHGNWPGGNRILPNLPGAMGEPTVPPTIIPWVDGKPLIGGHSAYPDSPELKSMPLPFDISQPWPTDGSGAYRATQIDNLTQSFRDATSGEFVERATGMVNLPAEVAKTGVSHFVLAPADHALDNVFSHTPDSVRTTYDRASDWVLNRATTGPTVTEAVVDAAGGAGQIAIAPAQGAWDVMSGTGRATNDLVHGRFGEAADEFQDGVVDGATSTASDLWNGIQDLGGGVLDTIL